MKRAYSIPVGNRTFTEFSDYVSSMDIVFDGARELSIHANGYVEVDGQINDVAAVEVALQVTEKVGE